MRYIHRIVGLHFSFTQCMEALDVSIVVFVISQSVKLNLPWNVKQQFQDLVMIVLSLGLLSPPIRRIHFTSYSALPFDLR